VGLAPRTLLFAVALAAVPSFGCNAIFGVGDLAFEPASTAASSGGNGAAGGSGGAGGAGGATLGPCGSFDVIADDFDDSITDSSRWSAVTANGATVTETPSGRLQVSLPIAMPGADGSYESLHAYDLTASRAAVQVVTTPAPASAQLYFEVQVGTQRMAMRLQAGVLVAALDGSGNPGEILSVTYDPSQRWWSLRAQGKQLVWETSSDGASWQEFATADASSFDARYAVVRMGARQTATMGAVYTDVELDDFRGDGVPAALCPTSDLTEDFTDSAMSPAWQIQQAFGSCTLAESAGKLVVTLDTSGSVCDYHSTRRYDLRASAVTVQLADVPDAGGSFQLGVAIDSENDIEIGYGGDDNLYYELETAGISYVSAAVFVPNERWWRIREAAGDLYWEVSTDGATWETRRQLRDPSFPIDALAIRLEAQAGTISAPVTGAFDNVNLTP
jgi:hypothetical protein